jgi:hypothetical protein
MFISSVKRELIFHNFLFQFHFKMKSIIRAEVGSDSLSSGMFHLRTKFNTHKNRKEFLEDIFDVKSASRKL